MLDYHACSFLKIIDKGKSSINVQKIIVRNLLSVKFFEHLPRIAIKYSLLVGIFSVTKMIS